MNTIDPDENSRPFGFWLKAVDRLMAAEFAAAFESEGITRRDWRVLNIVDGSVAGDARPLSTHKLHRLIERGWVTVTEGTPALTDAGREAKQRLSGIVDGIRAKVTDAVPADDLATTTKTLEQLAVAFGWDEETPLPHGGRHRFGKGGGRRHRFGHGLGPGHGDEHCQHGNHQHGNHQHGDRRHGGPMRARFTHFTQDAYERGFDAGFTRARAER